MVRAGILFRSQHEKNGDVQQKHQKKSIDSIYIVHFTAPHPNFHGMARIHHP